jgi:hypothetical protein
MARPWTLTALTSVAALAVAAGALAPAAQATTAATRATAATAATAATRAAHQRTVWQPAEDTDWMWELSQPLNLSSPRLMGTGVTAWNGDTAPGDNPALYDIDGIINPAATVAKLHAMSDHVVCYIEVGTAGNYYSAAQEGIPVTYYQQLKNAGDLGKKIKGYPEYFININAPSAVSIIKAMIGKQCAAKGFDGVETDLDETFGGNEGKTGFTITAADEEKYLTTLSAYMHSLGLAWIAKNLDDTQNASFVGAMAPLAQGIISEQCNQYHTCSYLQPFLTAGKWVGNAEYSEPLSKFCASDNAADMNGVKFNVNLDGGRTPCR